MGCCLRKRLVEVMPDGATSQEDISTITCSEGQHISKELKAGEHFHHFGDVTIRGDVPLFAQLTVTDGNVIITGDVHLESKISLEHKPRSRLNIKDPYTLMIKGCVCGGKINTTASNVVICGCMNNQTKVETVSGNIQCLEVMDSFMKTVSGDISINQKLQNTKVNTVSGNIDASEISQSDVKTMSGDIVSDGNITSSIISTISGDIEYASSVESFVSTIIGQTVENESDVNSSGSTTKIEFI